MATNETEIEINSQHSPNNDKRTVGDFLNISRDSGEKAKHFLREILNFNISGQCLLCILSFLSFTMCYVVHFYIFFHYAQNSQC